MVVMYCLGLFFSFTMLILQEWQHIHYQNQLNQTDKFQLLHFTAKEWKAKDNKREFQINGVYYDVQSISYKENGVVAKVAIWVVVLQLVQPSLPISGVLLNQYLQKHNELSLCHGLFVSYG